MGKVGKVLKRLDVFPKTLDDFKEKSFSGGAISIFSILLIFSFLILEISEYTSKEIQTELVVDSSRSSKIDVYLDITFPSLPCSFLSLDAVDVAGETQFEISESINKIRLDENGRVMSRDEIARKESESLKDVNTQVVIPKNANNCGTCYGAETEKYPCCETCEDVRNAYKIKGWAFSAINSIAQCKNEGATEKMKVQKNEGCRVFGTFDVEKVAGNFHISPGRSFESSHAHVHDTAGMDFGSFNLSHTITQLNIGNKSGKQNSIMPTPILNGVSKTTEDPSSLFQYFLKIVPASYDSGNEVIDSYQYSYTEFYKTISGHDHTGNPGVYFMYDLSPIRVKYYYSSTALPLFITKVLAIIGGIYTLSSLADNFFHYGLPNLLQKLRK